MQSNSKPYILFVDDEEMTRKTFQRIAGKEFEVLTAESVAAAKTLLDIHAEDVGVLLSDQRMPGALGVELLEYCRDSYPWIIRMLTTAYSDLADAIAAVNRGEIIRYIEKPWNNIDALLIDLRVAMRFHLLERENKQLLEEKLSAGAAISRLDRVRSLIEIAAAQRDYENPLVAVEAMLRDMSALESVQNPLQARALQELEMFGQPVSDTLSAIGVAQGIADLSGSSTATNWQEILDVCKRAGAEVSIASSKHPQQKAGPVLAHISAGFSTALSGDARRVKVAVEESEQGWHLVFAHREAGEELISDWFSGLHMEEANQAMAGLLLGYLGAYELGMRVSVKTDKNMLVSINLEGSAESIRQQNSLSQPIAEWVDDILLLYA